MKYFKKLVGERIYLSPRNNEDVEKFTEWLNDFDITDYLGRSDTVFAIIDLEKDEMIGSIALEGINHTNRVATLGIFIGNKQYWNKGYGTEAIRLILDYGFNYLNLHCIQLHLMSFNQRALKCYQKCGFKETGRIRECRFINGKYYDIICMDILSSEFTGSYIKNKNIE